MSHRKFITQGEGLPQWSNPISHAVVVNDTCYVSGQLSVNLEGEYVRGTIEEETIQAFKNVFAVLKAAAFQKSDIVYIDLAFSDLTQVDAMNQIYMDLFQKDADQQERYMKPRNYPLVEKLKLLPQQLKSWVDY